jgi:hypothetical protein
MIKDYKENIFLWKLSTIQKSLHIFCRIKKGIPTILVCPLNGWLSRAQKCMQTEKITPKVGPL